MTFNIRYNENYRIFSETRINSTTFFCLQEQYPIIPGLDLLEVISINSEEILLGVWPSKVKQLLSIAFIIDNDNRFCLAQLYSILSSLLDASCSSLAWDDVRILNGWSTMHKFVFAFELQDFGLPDAVRHESLITCWGSCTESYHILLFEVPYTSKLLIVYCIWVLINDSIVFVEDDYRVVSSILVKVVDGYYLDAEVNECKLLSSLTSQSFVWLDDCHFLPLVTVVLRNKTLNPCFAWASWRDDNSEGINISNHYACYSCLVVTVSIEFYFITDSLRKCDHIVKCHSLLKCRSMIRVELLYLVEW